ncbi:conserved hypothetical protein [uncultured Dysgonomonas sp.]|uniref:Uncharacterized protein n=1 Tax=uncultured Dysgonomonas sp. TaxID=206096 RepID=A0A212IZX3_9BACT|nr:conserved hypothetical protein [uncultured Dysgonomonas sp.]
MATFAGSKGFKANGRPVFVLQNLHERVHISPPIINVAVPLPQHSPMFGQRPLVQIVCNPCDSTIFKVSEKWSLPPSFIFNQSGFFTCSIYIVNYDFRKYKTKISLRMFPTKIVRVKKSSIYTIIDR